MREMAIIGRGLSGLIALFNSSKESLLFGPKGWDVVSQGASPIVLHARPGIDSWMERVFGVRVRKSVCFVNYYFRRGLAKQIPEVVESQYVSKSRRISIVEAKRRSRRKAYSDFEFYAVPPLELLDRLERLLRGRIIGERVWSVGRGVIQLEHGEKISGFDQIISTVPAPVWARLSLQEFNWLSPDQFTSTSKWHVRLTDDEVEKIIPSAVWSRSSPPGCVYFPEKKQHPFLLRLSNLFAEKDGEVVAEYSACPSDQKARPSAVRHAYFETPKSIPPPPPGVSFLGRAAEWNEDVMLHDIIGRRL